MTPSEIHEERKRARQPDPVQMCAVVEEDPSTTLEEVVLVLVGVAAVCLFAASLAGALA